MQPGGKFTEMNWKITIGGGVLVFLVGATFWAGAAYNRLDSIESQLREMHTQMGQIGEVPILKIRVETLELEVKRLVDQHDSGRR